MFTLHKIQPFTTLCLSILFISSVMSSDNLAMLEKNAKKYQQHLLTSQNKKNPIVNTSADLNLKDTAYFFYKNKECKLAIDIQKKLIAYQLSFYQEDSHHQNKQAFNWYQLSLYSACAYDKRIASKAIYLAWQDEKEDLIKSRYKEMMVDYLFSIYQLKLSWNKDLTSLYQQLKDQVNKPDNKKESQQTNEKESQQQLQEINSKLEQLAQIKADKSDLIFSKIESELDSYRDQQQLKICMAVNLSGYWDNKENRQIKLEDYIRISPKINPSFERNYNALCILGAKWSTDYKIEILKGLVINSKILKNNQILTIKTEAQPANFWFKKNRYILSRHSNSQLPIYAVNTPKIHVSLFRILPENLQNKEFLRLFKRNISNYELKKVSQQLGNKVWSSDVLLENDEEDNQSKNLNKTFLNKTRLRQIPLPQEFVKKAGVYILIAAENKDQIDTKEGYHQLSAQWLFVSDIGLTSYKSSQGLTVLAHSLETGKSLTDLNLSLYSENNSLLAKGTTDEQGKVSFSAETMSRELSGKKGLQAMQLIASHPEHGFLFYPLQSAGFDLSDRGVSGRISLGSMEAYLYSERGIYRPGEKVSLITLLRDDQAQAIEGLPLTLKIINPDGQVIREQLIMDNSAGGYAYSFVLPMAIRTGKWKFEVYADVSAPALGFMDFLVEEIKPPRLQASISSDNAALYGGIKHQDKSKQFKIQADYLFGAPASNLQVNGYLSLTQTRSPFGKKVDGVKDLDFSQYVFGTEIDLEIETDYFEIFMQETNAHFVTDKNGHLSIPVKWPENLKTKQTLSGLFRAEIIDHDGSMVAVQKTFNVLNLPLYLGIGKSFQQFAPENTDFQLKIISLDENAKLNQQENLNWRLIREESYFQWFNKQGNWFYEKMVKEQLEQKGIIENRQADIELLTFKLAQGQYRLEVFEPKTEVVSSYQFSVGEQINSINDLPDVVKLSLDKPAYQIEDEIELTIESPYVGEADIIIADNKIHSILKLHLNDKKTKIKIPVSKDWGVGSYALVSVYHGEKSPQLAKRAMGVIWINRDKAPYKLDISIQTVDKIKPNQVLEIPIKMTGLSQTDLNSSYVTIAAVDQGVLDLTNYKSPKPVSYFLAKRQLETQINDNYARLIDNINGKPARLREGGGAMEMSLMSTNAKESTPAKNIKITSLFSGIVKTDHEGNASIKLDIPDFNGQLKLMAVAWTKGKMGSTEKTLYVNDDVVVQASLPRFMSSDDKVDISLLINNLHAPAGEYSLQLITDNLLVTPKEQSKLKFRLEKEGSSKQSFSVLAKQVGNAQLKIILNGPNHYQLQKNYNIGIRGKALPSSEQRLEQLDAHSEWNINQADMQSYEPNSVSKTISLSSGLNLGVYALLEKLDRYPHGCLEQLVSQAMPLLSVNTLSKRWNYPIDPMLGSRINDVISSIIDKQRYDGSFGLWSPQDKQEAWLSLYAMEFLLEASSQSYRVPDFYLQRGLKWVKNTIELADYDQPKQLALVSYAHLVLVKSSLSSRLSKSTDQVENARYLAKQYADKLPSLLAYGQLFKSLQLMGEDKLATELLEKVDILHFKRGIKDQNISRYDYGSQLRDMAGFASLIAPPLSSSLVLRTGSLEEDETSSRNKSYTQAIQWISQILNFPDSINHRKYLSTQEQAWLIRLALSLGEDSPLKLSLDGLSIASGKNDFSLNYTYQQLEQSKFLNNQANRSIWANTTVYGVPKQVKAFNNGFKINKILYDESGQVVDLSNIKQGQRYIMLIKGEATTGLFQRAMIVDLLSAGLEIENANLTASFDIYKLKWLPKLSSTRYIEALDDRFVAAIDIAKGNDQKFSLAYPVRAITLGEFNYPAIYIEDMYQPYFKANTRIGKLKVVQP